MAISRYFLKKLFALVTAVAAVILVPGQMSAQPRTPHERAGIEQVRGYSGPVYPTVTWTPSPVYTVRRFEPVAPSTNYVGSTPNYYFTSVTPANAPIGVSYELVTEVPSGVTILVPRTNSEWSRCGNK